MIDKLASATDPAIEAILSDIHANAVGSQFTDSTPSLVPDGKLVIHDDGAGDEGLSVKSAEGNILTFIPLTAATQAQMEAGTATTAAVTPAVVKNSPGVSKGWVSINGADGVINASYNVTSVVRNGTGDYTITWNTDFSSAAYAVGLSWLGGSVDVTRITAIAAGTLQVTCKNIAGTDTDPTTLTVIGFGDQA